MDTGNDYRILVIEDAFSRLGEILRLKRFRFQFKHYKDAQEQLEQAKRALTTIKYCYLEPDAIMNMPEFQEFQICTNGIEQMITDEIKAANYKPDNPKDLWVIKELEYALSIFRDFVRRIQLPPYAGSALDTFSAQVTRVEKHPEFDKLFICRATNTKHIWNIVTNIPSIQKDKNYAVVHLPPSMFGSVVSDAMFVASQPILEEPGTLLKLTGPLLNSVNSQVFALLKK